MRKQNARSAQVAIGRLGAEVGDAARVDVCMFLDLACKQALVHTGSHQRAPDQVSLLARGPCQRRDAFVEFRQISGGRSMAASTLSGGLSSTTRWRR